MALLKVSGPIRLQCLDMGTTKWKEGSFEIVEKENKASLVVRYNSGGSPRTFQLNKNITKILLRPSGQQSRLMLNLKDNLKDVTLTIDKVPRKDAQELNHYLEQIHKGRLNPAGKMSQGSCSFGIVLGNRTGAKESSRQLSDIANQTNQTPARRASFERKDETPVRRPLGSPGRANTRILQGNVATGGRPTIALSPSPARTGLSEYSSNKAATDPARKFLNSSREKQLNLKQTEENRNPGSVHLQSSSFYGSKTLSKDYATGNSFSDRTLATNQASAVKRSLGFQSQTSPVATKKLRLGFDYAGWSKTRACLPPSVQPQLQGFSNLGNTCYMNAILQSLFLLPSFANDMLKQGIQWRKVPTNALSRRFALLLAKKDFCTPEMKKDLLKKVKSAISATAERFSGYMQNDAHEFLSQCLDQLKEDMEKLNKTWRLEPLPGEENSGGQTLEDPASARLYTCPVVSNLEFEVQHSITCKMCGETVTKREQFNDLSIDLPRRRKVFPCRSIQESLDLFFRPEEIEYCCERCSGKSAVVSHKFSRLPRVLILHLKRYSFNVALSLNNKVGQQVIIPKYMTLLPHCTENTRPPLTLGWNVYAAIFHWTIYCNPLSSKMLTDVGLSRGQRSRPLKTSQSLNSCTLTCSTPSRKSTFKSLNSQFVSLDSDSDEDQLRRAKAQRHNAQQFREKQQEEEDFEKVMKGSKKENAFDGLSDDEVLAAILEISKKETSLCVNREDEEKSLSSPDTGFGDEVNEPSDNQSLVVDRLRVPVETGPESYTNIATDFDENKENKTPEGTPSDADWLQQYDLEQEREEQELQQALVQSLQEQEAREQKEDDDLKRATELSLKEFNTSFLDEAGSEDDSGNEEIHDMEYTHAEAEELNKNAELGELPHSYRLTSVVSHIGSTSSSGHYICDVYDFKKQAWFTYNDLDVSRTQESIVQSERDRSGYIFFYMHKDVFDELLETEKNTQPVCIDISRPVLQPL
ncbi:ubiquitin carboxyl-terminal hydrolase 37 [Protopterus annectens]|uniref:ubiquitin carboxyl-terminal hydrolase 37 n=1 Tax=Protopterus annectens TaxID=7888 RepID=UPI001CFAC88E|nr:ubiquitin carboxyl-terminal hydrolase 37 [Protopterus annectens]